MHSFRRHSFVQRWVSLVSLLLLLQGMFPVQMHTMLVSDGQGNLVQVCTIDGLKTVHVDHAGNIIDPEGLDKNERSSAIEFSELMAEAHSYAFIPVIYPEAAPAASASNSYIAVYPDVVSGLMPIRAPPVA